jgi:hypothetical protein
VPDEQKPLPLDAYLLGDLTPEQDAALARRAMEDDETLEALWDLSEASEILEDPEARRELLRRLEKGQSRTGPARWLAFLKTPLGRLALTGLAAVAGLVIWAPWEPPITEQPLTLVSNANTQLSDYFKLPPRNSMAVKWELKKNSFRRGERVEARLHLEKPASVFVLRREAGGQTALVFPPDALTSANRPAGDVSLAFDPAPSMQEVRAPQAMTVRVLVLPVNYDIRRQTVRWRELRSHSAVDAHYQIRP